MYGRHIVDQVWIGDWLDPRHRARLLRDPLWMRLLVRCFGGRGLFGED